MPLKRVGTPAEIADAIVFSVGPVNVRTANFVYFDTTTHTIGPEHNLAGGRFALLETLSGDGGIGFGLVPWQPVLDERIGQHITGVMLDSGGMDWSFGRKRGLWL